MTGTRTFRGHGRLGNRAVARIDYGAMQLGKGIDDDQAARLLRRAVELGVNHIDTASFYHHGEVNRHIRDALAPYPDDLLIVSKVGARPTTDGPIPMMPAQRPGDLRAAVEADLAQLRLEQIPVVNLRRLDVGPLPPQWLELKVGLDEQMAEMIAMRDEGKIGDIGLSNVSLDVLRNAAPAGIACVQNCHNLHERSSRAQLEFCADNGIAWVPYFPLGSAFGTTTRVPDNPAIREIADDFGCTPAQLGLAWLLAHAVDTLLIPGTRSIAHLKENLGALAVTLDGDTIRRLDALRT